MNGGLAGNWFADSAQWREGGIIISYTATATRALDQQALQNSHFSMAKGNFFPSLNVGHFVTAAMAILAATGMLIHNRGHGARAGLGWDHTGAVFCCLVFTQFHTWPEI